jgi:hypothetical protein
MSLASPARILIAADRTMYRFAQSVPNRRIRHGLVAITCLALAPLAAFADPVSHAVAGQKLAQQYCAPRTIRGQAVQRVPQNHAIEIHQQTGRSAGSTVTGHTNGPKY